MQIKKQQVTSCNNKNLILAQESTILHTMLDSNYYYKDSAYKIGVKTTYFDLPCACTR